MYLRFVIWEFVKFLWNRSSLNAFAVCIWIDRYMDNKTKLQLADCLNAECRMEN